MYRPCCCMPIRYLAACITTDALRKFQSSHLAPLCCHYVVRVSALHQGMERMKSCARVSRAAHKAPQHRSNLDVSYIAAETQGIPLLVQHGPGVHRDLCHVLQHCSLPQMASMRLPSEHPSGVFVYVSEGVAVHWCCRQSQTLWPSAMHCSAYHVEHKCASNDAAVTATVTHLRALNPVARASRPLC